MKLKVAILGTGKIGTDLLLKCLKKHFIDVVAFVGRRLDSDAMDIAKSRNINISDLGIEYFIANPGICDLVFDCTNAEDARRHSLIFQNQGIKVIDMTPSKVGEMCVPSINGDIILQNNNVNMITCGGQASLPMLDVLTKHCTDISYIEVVSQIASKSAGMATRINIDDYIATTNSAIFKFTGCKNTKVILNLNPSEPCVNMQTTIFIKSNSVNFDNLTEEITERIKQLKKYIPHYEIVLQPTLNQNGILITSIRVMGSGDYLPEYAGNLDIINCAAIELTENLI